MPTTGSTGTINLTEKASSKVLERFKLGSCTEGLFSHEYEFTGVKTVKIYSIDTMEVVDYDPEWTGASGRVSRFGALTNIGDTVQEFTVTQNKAFSGAIDESYNTNQMQIKKAGQILKRQTDEVLIPMLDKYRLQAFANAVSAATSTLYDIAATSFSKANIVETIMGYNAVLSDQLVPDTGRVLYMSYQDAVKLKLADQVVGIDKLGEKSIVNGVMGKVDKTQIRLVPESYMPTLGTGSSAKKVKMLFIKTGIALAPMKIHSYKVHDGAHVLDGKIVTGHLMHDCFVLKKAKDASGNPLLRGVIAITQTST